MSDYLKFKKYLADNDIYVTEDIYEYDYCDFTIECRHLGYFVYFDLEYLTPEAFMDYLNDSNNVIEQMEMYCHDMGILIIDDYPDYVQAMFRELWFVLIKIIQTYIAENGND